MFSIRWKLTIAIILTAITFMLFYIVLAKNTFETDKISYVFETQNSKLESHKNELERQINNGIMLIRSLVSHYNQSQNYFNQSGIQLFNDAREILGLQIIDSNTYEIKFKLEKKETIFETLKGKYLNITPNSWDTHPLEEGKILLQYRFNNLIIRSIVETDVLLSTKLEQSNYYLLSDAHIISAAQTKTLLDRQIEALVENLLKEKVQSKTFVWTNNQENYLVSYAIAPTAKIQLISLMPESTALGALSVLFRKSVIFLTLSFFILIAMSLWISRGLTTSLRLITNDAEKIGQGHFDETTVLKTKDEIGVLSKAMSKMSLEIKRLLNETKEKARMESELKTAKIVQEQLFPEQQNFQHNRVELSGQVLTCTECGGDWWYYFTQNDFLYVVIADATGHGTPAALITSAARSIFSKLETESNDIQKMMISWNQAVKSCSKGKVIMSGLLLKINTLTGNVEYLSAGHEPPYIFNQSENSDYTSAILDLDLNNHIGNDFPINANIQKYTMTKKSSIILFTDGLFSITNSEGKELNERRLGQSLAKNIHDKNAEEQTGLILDFFAKHRGTIDLPDDVTIVTIKMN